MGKYESESIRKILSRIDNEEIYLPSIQREFVWEQERINKFFDSVMRDYPIGTFLLWTTKDQIQVRKFIFNYHDDLKLSDLYVPTNSSKKTLVLDGQQRLQSMYIALRGLYEGSEFYFDILSGKEIDPRTSEIYRFGFFKKGSEPNGWILFTKLIYSDKTATALKRDVIEELQELGMDITDDAEELIEENISRAKEQFVIREMISYYNIDSIDGSIRNQDEILEIFVRTNMGGISLTPSDLVFSTLKVDWADVEKEFEDLLEDVNGNGAFEFDKDFIVKCCLTLIGAGAEYNVQKLRGEAGQSVKEKIRMDWQRISDSIRSCIDFLERNGITSSELLVSSNALIPIIYFSFLKGGRLDSLYDKVTFRWLCLALLNRNFGGQADTVINACKKAIDDANFASKRYFPASELDNVIPKSKKVGFVKDLADWKGGEKLILSLIYWPYGGVKFNPLMKYNNPEVDHIFPKSKLRDLNVDNKLIQDIGNLRYISQSENRTKIPVNGLKILIMLQLYQLTRSQKVEIYGNSKGINNSL